MTDDRRVLSLLTEVLDRFPTAAPDRLLASVIEGVGTTPQRRGWQSTRGWRAFASEPFTRRRAAGSMAIVVAVVVTAVAFAQFGPHPDISGPGSLGSPSQSPSVPPSPSASASTSSFDGAIEDVGAAELTSGVAYRSRLFEPPVAFKLLAYGLKQQRGQETDFCLLNTSSRTIVLGWKSGCVSDLRIIRPFAVECGTADTHPDAETLATAILAKPNMGGLRDDGSIQDAIVLFPKLFQGNPTGRVVDLLGGRLLDPKATDPDRCRLMPEPGSADPVIEIRGDLTARLILLDIHDELVVLRLAGGGYDAPTGAAARARGYGAGGDMFDRMLGAIYDVEFK